MLFIEKRRGWARPLRKATSTGAEKKIICYAVKDLSLVFSGRFFFLKVSRFYIDTYYGTIFTAFLDTTERGLMISIPYSYLDRAF